MTNLLETDPICVRWKAALDGATTDVDRLEALLWLGRRLAGLDNEQATTLMAQAQVLAERLGDPRARAFLYLNRLEIGGFSSSLELFSLQLKDLLRAEQAAREAGDRGLCLNLMHYRALLVGRDGSMFEALPLIDEILDDLEKDPPRKPLEWEALAGTHSMVAMGLQRGHDLEGALRHYRLSLDALSHLELHTGYPLAYGLFADLLMQAGRFDEARVAVERIDVLRAQTPWVSLLPEPFYEVRKLRLEALATDTPEARHALGTFLTDVLFPMVAHLPDIYRIEFLVQMAEMALVSRQWSLLETLVELSLRERDNVSAGNFFYSPRLFRLQAEAAGQRQDYREQVRLLEEATRDEHRSQSAQLGPQIERLKLTRQIEAQFQQTTRMTGVLESFLPKPIVRELVDDGTSAPRQVAHAALLVGDIAQFSTVSATLSAEQVFSELTGLFSGFDEVVNRAGGQRLKTIGDAYFAVAGLLDGRPQPVRTLVEAVVEMLGNLSRRTIFREMRFGLAVGPVTAGIVGSRQYLFDVLGHTVNLAFRLEAAAPIGAVLMHDDAAAELMASGPLPRGCSLAKAGAVDLKGVGRTETWLLSVDIQEPA